jgi:carbonic anhydrase/acetyltransferase-like protein (isoleucine patch superfamily)
VGHRPDMPIRLMRGVRPNVKTSWAGESKSPGIHATSHIDPMAVVIGDVNIGRHVNIAPGASIRADEGMPIVIGDESNIQDGVIIHSLKGQGVKIGRRVSLSHGAIVHGPANIGDGTFVGFGSVVYQCNIGCNCVVLHNAVVTGNITIPDGKYIASCSLIQDVSAAEALPDVPEELSDFASEVVDVNKELAAGYIRFEKQERVRRTYQPISKKARRREFWQWVYENLEI